MSVPPVPPRPYSAGGYGPQRQSSLSASAPPVPPLPPDFRVNGQYESPPHFDQPLAAPRPHKVDPSIPANMAQTLDDQLHPAYDHHRPSPAPPYPPQGINYNPGFAIPTPGPPGRGPSPMPPPAQATNWSPWAPQNDPYRLDTPQQHYRQRTYSTPGPPQPQAAAAPAYAATDYSFGTQYQSQAQALPQRHQSTYGPPPKPPSPPRTASSGNSGVPSLTAPLPTIQALQSALQTVQQPTHDPALRLAWARDVLLLVDKQQNPTSTDTPIGPAIVSDPTLLRLSQIAVPIVLQIASTAPSPGTGAAPPHVAEAIYLRASFAATGAYPDQVKHNPRAAFRDFESSARAGYAAAWFKIGRDYETFNDFQHARECFERGVKLGIESCAYRMGMAHLMGQLGLPSNPSLAIPLLHRAATLATIQTPQPAYVYALLLLGEFTQFPPSSSPSDSTSSNEQLPPSLFAPFIPPNSSQLLEARKHLERAAYLNFAPAQYKLGHAYEFAQPPFPFDPLLSVQYYSLASQQGEVEADMALSKWFLCGSGDLGPDGGEGFDKDEALAWTFADKAARRGLPSAEFAMGYYAEVGVGGPKDIQSAVRWYTKAKEHGNTDAAERLAALTQVAPQALSRQEHDKITENKLVRKRTQAKQRSETLAQEYPPMPVPGQHASSLPSSPYPSGGGNAQGPRPQPRRDGKQVVDVIRRNSLMMTGSGPAPHQSPYQQQQQLQHPPQQQSPQHMRPQSGPPGRAAAQPQQFPAMNRYTLSDAPVPSSGRKSPTASSTAASRPGMGMGGRPGAGSAAGGRKASAGTPAPAPFSLDPLYPPNGEMPPVPPLPSAASSEGVSSAGSTPSGLEGASVGAGGGLVIPARPPGKGPTTFAEMGFQGAKAEDKECVIM